MKMLLLSVLFFTLYVASHANGYVKNQENPVLSSESAQGFILWKELLSFVVNQSTGKQLHIVYDDFFRDISFSPHLKELFSSDIVIYDIGLNEDDDVHSSNNQTVEHNNINQFRNVLIDSKYTLDMKNVIIICNIQTVIEIFKEVRQHSLESPNIQWFLVLQNDNVGDLLSYLREGTQISLAKKVDNAKYGLYNTWVGVEDEVRLQRVGSFWLDQESKPHHHLISPWVPILDVIYKDFSGRQLQSSVKENWSFIKEDEDITFEDESSFSLRTKRDIAEVLPVEAPLQDENESLPSLIEAESLSALNRAKRQFFLGTTSDDEDIDAEGSTDFGLEEGSGVGLEEGSGVGPERKSCDPPNYECNSGMCIDSEKRCDGAWDCDDGSDELISCQKESMPVFLESIPNKTVVVGREVILPCSVDNLKGYKVAWIFVETQTVLTIHHTIMTRNPRFSLARNDHKHWYLKISDVKPTDRGSYMCQVNTDPMMSQTGFLDVQEPCSANEFMCNDRSCVPLSERCDGIEQCPDRSDEVNCPTDSCLDNQFRCGDGTCIENSWKCDNVPDCIDTSDEHDCTCRGSDFTCSDGSCVDRILQCNGYGDCTDGSDEVGCSGDLSWCTSPLQTVGSQCFLFSEVLDAEQRMNRKLALSVCKENGGSLAEPDSLEILKDYYHGKTGVRLWVGAKKSHGSSSFIWDLKQENVNASWITAHYLARGDCLQYRSGTNMLHQATCDKKLQFICEKPNPNSTVPVPGPSPNSTVPVPAPSYVGDLSWCTSPLQTVGSQCFFFSEGLDAEQLMNRWLALSFCKENGGSLAEPNSLEILKDHYRGRTGVRLWVGAKKSHGSSSFVWELKQENVNASWITAHYLARGDCLQYRSGTNMLHQATCDKKLQFICEIPSSGGDLPWCTSPLQTMGSQCFFFSEGLDAEQSMNRGLALSFCKENGGSLAEPDSLEILKDHYRGRTDERLWVGAKKSHGSSSFIWDLKQESVNASWIIARYFARGDCLQYRSSDNMLHQVTCDKKLRFICEKPNPNTPDPVPAPSSGGDLPWCTNPLQTVGSQCFLFSERLDSEQHMNRWLALSFCEENGGRLAEPDSLEILKYHYRGRTGVRIWVGAKKLRGSSSFIWDLKQENVNASWITAHNSARGNCLQYRSGTNMLHQTTCDKKLLFVCESPNPNSPVPVPDPSSPGGDLSWCTSPQQTVGFQCFFFSEGFDAKQRMNRGLALSFCKENGGSLAEPDSLEIIKDHYRGRTGERFWVGAKKSHGSSSFVWDLKQDNVNASWITSRYFARGDCLHYRSGDNMLHQTTCDKKLRFMCERPNPNTPVPVPGWELESCVKQLQILQKTCVCGS